MAVLLAVVLVAAACQGASAPSGSAQATLMSRLALEGDHALFDARYVSVVGADGVLFVGTKGGEAVGYLCDPAAGSRWLTGTSKDGKLDLSDAKGGHLSGPVTAATFDATISGIPGYDGAVTLAAAPDARLIREQSAQSGQLVGGLVFDGAVTRGVFTVSATGTLKPGLASIPAGTPIAIGVRSTVGPRIDLTISTKPKLPSELEAAAIREIRATEEKIKAERENASAMFYLAVSCAVATVAVATGAGAVAGGAVAAAGAVAGVGDAAVTALKSGKLSDVDPTTNAFLTNALKDILAGIQVSVGIPRPSGSAAPQPVTLGTVTFGTFSGGL